MTTRTRSQRTNGVELDNVLLALQGEGHKICQILPCVCEVLMEEVDDITVRGGVQTEFMVIYIEEVEEVGSC